MNIIIANGEKSADNGISVQFNYLFEFMTYFKTKQNTARRARILTLPSMTSSLAHDIRVLKSKTKETPKFLSSAGTRGAKFISVYNFSAQQLSSSENQRILNFKVVAVRDIKLLTFMSKNLYLSRDF